MQTMMEAQPEYATIGQFYAAVKTKIEDLGDGIFEPVSAERQEDVYPIMPNAKLSDYPVGSQARIRAERYAYSYSSLLSALHRSFNGDPKNIATAIGLMYELKVQSVSLMSTPLDDGSGLTAGPSYDYVNVQGGMASAGSAG